MRRCGKPTRKQEGHKLELGVTHGDPLPGVPLGDWSALRRYLDELDTVDDLERFGT